jgi:hypothetical protein
VKDKRTEIRMEASNNRLVVPFPWKLHQMLEDAQTYHYEAIVSWLPQGQGFRVHNPDHFVDQVMTRHFKQTKYKSFQRQLNMWGFERVNYGPHRGGYSHEFFVRDQETLCHRMIRQKLKGTANQSSASKNKNSAAAATSLTEKKEDAVYSPDVMKQTLCSRDVEVVVPPFYRTNQSRRRISISHVNLKQEGAPANLPFSPLDGELLMNYLPEIKSLLIGNEQGDMPIETPTFFDLTSHVDDLSSFAGRHFYVVDDCNPNLGQGRRLSLFCVDEAMPARRRLSLLSTAKVPSEPLSGVQGSTTHQESRNFLQEMLGTAFLTNGTVMATNETSGDAPAKFLLLQDDEQVPFWC